MQLENALKISGLSCTIAQNTKRCTGENSLNKQDVVSLLGYVQNQEPIGLALVEMKYRKCTQSKRRAMRYIEISAIERLERVFMRKLKDKETCAARMIARLALHEYAKTADDAEVRCNKCKGRGTVTDAFTGAIKSCKHCHGLGIKRISHAALYRAVAPFLSISLKTFYSSAWLKLFERLCAWCEEEAWAADKACKQLSQDD